MTVRRNRVLLIEDSAIIGMMTADCLVDEGFDVVGPFGDVRSAGRAARTEAIDVALVDIDLAGEQAYPVADTLSERGIPFAFLTGYDVETLRPAYRRVPVIGKPFQSAGLVTALRHMLAATPCPATAPRRPV